MSQLNTTAPQQKVLLIIADLSPDKMAACGAVKHVVREYMASNKGDKLVIDKVAVVERKALLTVQRHAPSPRFLIWCTPEQSEAGHAAIRAAYTKYAAKLLESAQRVVDSTSMEPERVKA